MKTNLLKIKPPIGFWIFTSTVLFLTSSFLFTERWFWKWESGSGGRDEGMFEALNDIHNERFQYLALDPNGYFNFTGELDDGVEVWNHAYAESFPFTTPFRVRAEAYVSAYNGQMKNYVRRLDKPPSAVERRSAELTDEEFEIRQRAARFLGMMGTQAEEAILPLIAATSDEYAEVRAQATWALGKIGPGDYGEEVIAALELVREIPNSTMQEIASRALDEVNARTEEIREEIHQ